MFWPQKRIQNLQKKSSEAIQRIINLIEDKRIPVNRNHAWGQFLDDARDSNQYGIYGTSAAIQILVAHGYPASNELIAGAISTLQEIVEENTATNRFKIKGDFIDLYKKASLIEALDPCEPEIPDDDGLVTSLKETKLNSQGWGEYASTSSMDSSSKILSTTFVLLALRRCSTYKSSAGCQEAIRWLCNRLDSNGTLSQLELALAGLVLKEYRSTGVDIDTYEPTLKALQLILGKIADKRRSGQILESKVHHYAIELDSVRTNRYLFFLPDCITALFFIQSKEKRCNHFVLRVVKAAIQNVVDNGAFISSVSSKISTVDQLWICSLLQKFCEATINDLKPILWNAIGKTGRWIARPLLIAFTGIGAYLLLVDVSTFVKIIGWAMSGIGVSLIGSMIWGWLKGK